MNLTDNAYDLPIFVCGSFQLQTGHSSRNQIPRSRKHLVNPQMQGPPADFPHDAGTLLFWGGHWGKGEKSNITKIGGIEENIMRKLQVLPSANFRTAVFPVIFFRG